MPFPFLIKSVAPFSLIHCDVWGPPKFPNVTGAKRSATFINDYTQTTWLFLMKEKSEVTNFLNFHKIINTQFGVGMKRVKTDNLKEYFNHNLGPKEYFNPTLQRESYMNPHV